MACNELAGFLVTLVRIIGVVVLICGLAWAGDRIAR